MNIKKLNELSPKINERAIIEEIGYAPISFLEFASNDVSGLSLNYTKDRIKANVSARVLTSWIHQDVIIIEKKDEKKNKRFNRLESIWIRIAIELRSFGVPLENLKYIRTQLFDYAVDQFTIFKFQILQNILEKPKYLVVNDKGEVGFYYYKSYAELAEKGWLFSHINIKFIDILKEEFPDNNFHINFGIKDIDDDVSKVSLLFYLKTNDFKELRIMLSDGDVRLITNSTELKKNQQLLSAIEDWNFINIKVQINNDTEFLIEN